MIYQNELDKASFQHDIDNGDFKKFLIKYYLIKYLYCEKSKI